MLYMNRAVRDARRHSAYGLFCSAASTKLEAGTSALTA
jgi:hypothetical protein